MMITFEYPYKMRKISANLLYNFGILAPTDGRSVKIDPGGPPINGSRLYYGDRSCIHTNGTGYLTYMYGEIVSGGPIAPWNTYYSSYIVNGVTVASMATLVEPLSIGSSMVCSYPSSKYTANLSVTYSDETIYWSISDVIYNLAYSHFPSAHGTISAPAGSTVTKAIELVCDQSIYSSYIGSLKFRFTVSASAEFVSGMSLEDYDAESDNKFKLIASRDFHLTARVSDLVRANGDAREDIEPTLVTNCASNLKYVDINGLAYLGDCHRLVATTRGMMKIIRNIKSPKAWANAWLSYRYGLPLFIQDSSKIIAAARKQHRTSESLKRVKSSYKSEQTGLMVRDTINIESHCCMKLDLLTQAQETFFQTTRKLDIFPSLSNLWDLIPFSFVVDWVIPVDDALQRLDAANDILSFPVREGIVSHKGTIELEADQWVGTATLSHYERMLYSQQALSRLPLSWTDIKFDPDINLRRGIDTLSLIVQRWTR